MQAANRVAVNTGILYARMAITVFISLYATRLILGALGAEDFGLFNVVGGAIAMLTFLNNAMTTATQRFMSFAQGAGDHDRQKSIFNVSVVLHLLIAIVIFLLLEGAGYFLFNGILKISPERLEAAKLIYQFMIVSTLFTIISVPYDAVINAHENMLLFAILGIIEAVLKLTIAIFITYSAFDKLSAYGFLMAALSILLLIIRRIYCHRKYTECHIHFRKYFDKSLFKEITCFAGWSFFGCSSSMFAFYGQGIVINIFFGAVVNAAQGIASQVSGQLGAFAGTMLKALNPVIAKSEGAGNRELMLKASMMGSKISFFLLMLFYIPVLIEMPYIFKLWLKNVPDYAVAFCRLLLARNLIEQMFITLSSSITAVGDIRKFQIYSSILAFFPLLISYFLFSIGYPAYSLYVVFIIYSLLASAVILHFSEKICHLSVSVFLTDVVLRCGISFFLVLAISTIPLFFLPESMIRAVSIIIISLIFFLPAIWYIGFNTEERQGIGKMIISVAGKFRLNKIIPNPFLLRKIN